MEECIIRNYEEGREVSVNVKSLYEMEEKISYGVVVPDYEDGQYDYYDLYNARGELACCDGEKCTIEYADRETVVLSNNDGKENVYFQLTTKEADQAIYM